VIDRLVVESCAVCVRHSAGPSRDLGRRDSLFRDTGNRTLAILVTIMAVHRWLTPYIAHCNLQSVYPASLFESLPAPEPQATTGAARSIRHRRRFGSRCGWRCFTVFASAPYLNANGTPSPAWSSPIASRSGGQKLLDHCWARLVALVRLGASRSGVETGHWRQIGPGPPIGQWHVRKGAG